MRSALKAFGFAFFDCDRKISPFLHLLKLRRRLPYQRDQGLTLTFKRFEPYVYRVDFGIL